MATRKNDAAVTKRRILKVASALFASRGSGDVTIRDIAKGAGFTLATALFNGPWGNLNLFSALTNAIVHFFKTGKSPYPVERTLLVSGILDAAMHSHQAGGKPIGTPHLEFDYQPQDFAPFREDGASWRVITSNDVIT